MPALNWRLLNGIGMPLAGHSSPAQRVKTRAAWSSTSARASRGFHPANVASVETPGAQAAGAASPLDQGMESLATQVLHHFSTVLALPEQFRAAQQAQLDRQEAKSLAVTKQSLRRARLACSQLHTDLLGHDRHARTH